MVGFDSGDENQRLLDGLQVQEIHQNLSARVNTTQARPLRENLSLAFMGDTKGGEFNVELSAAAALLQEPNPHGFPNSDVVRPWYNVANLTLFRRESFIVDSESR